MSGTPMRSLPRHAEAFRGSRRFEPLLVRPLDPGVSRTHAQRLHEPPELGLAAERLGLDEPVRPVVHRARELELGGPAQHERPEADALDPAADHDAHCPHGVRMDSAGGPPQARRAQAHATVAGREWPEGTGASGGRDGRRARGPPADGMVGARVFDPPTPWSRTGCSTRLSPAPTLRSDAGPRAARGAAHPSIASEPVTIAASRQAAPRRGALRAGA